MQAKEENMWPFDVSKTRLSPRFMAGRGKVLLEISKSPLYAQEFAKRKRIQELLLKGELKLDQHAIPGELSLMKTSQSLLESKRTNDIKALAVTKMESKSDLPSSISTPQKSNFRNEKMGWNSVSLEQGDEFEDKEVQKQTLPWSTGIESKKYPSRERSARDHSRKDASGAKPLRKPEKSRKQYVAPPKKTNDVRINSRINSTAEKSQGKVIGDKNVWVDWENSVVVDGSLEDEDLPKIATVEDNDDIHDVIVNQYIDALQHNQQDKIPKQNWKLTPDRVQKFSKLKSTTNADCMRVSPGTQPNLPKGDNRWGGSELNGMRANTGWGMPNSGNRNQYDDGSSLWSEGGSQYGGVSWSGAS